MGIGREVGSVVFGQAAIGEGDSFRPRRGLPPRATLEYVQALATVLLLLLALALFGYYLIQSPKTAVRMALARVRP